jgi:hypothetical protein
VVLLQSLEYFITGGEVGNKGVVSQRYVIKKESTEGVIVLLPDLICYGVL